MSNYYNPPEDVSEGRVGRKLASKFEGNYEQAMRALLPGEHLYAYCDRLVFQQVAYVEDRQRFEAFWQQDMEGHFVAMYFVALSAADHHRAQEDPI